VYKRWITFELFTELSTLSTDYEMKYICYIGIHKWQKLLSKRNRTSKKKQN